MTWIGKAKDLTPQIIAKVYFQSLLNYTKTYRVKLPDHTRN